MVSDGPSIHERMVAAMRDISAVGKTGTADESQGGYRFRGIEAILAEVGPVLRTHGIFLAPEADDPTMGTYQTKHGTVMNHGVLPVTVHFVGEGGDRVSCRVLGEASDVGDKVLSKAHSVALRTALIEVFAIPTDEPEPEREESHERAAPPPQATDEQTATYERLLDETAQLDAGPRTVLKSWLQHVQVWGLAHNLTGELEVEWGNRLDEAKAAASPEEGGTDEQ